MILINVRHKFLLIFLILSQRHVLLPLPSLPESSNIQKILFKKPTSPTQLNLPQTPRAPRVRIKNLRKNIFVPRKCPCSNVPCESLKISRNRTTLSPPHLRFAYVYNEPNYPSMPVGRA